MSSDGYGPGIGTLVGAQLADLFYTPRRPSPAPGAHAGHVVGNATAAEVSVSLQRMREELKRVTRAAQLQEAKALAVAEVIEGVAREVQAVEAGKGERRLSDPANSAARNELFAEKYIKLVELSTDETLPLLDRARIKNDIKNKPPLK